MIALKVAHNGEPVCVAGIGDLGVISSHVTWVHSLDYRTETEGEPSERVELSLHVGGLHTPMEEHRTWDTPSIKVGDAVTVEIIETDNITPHSDARTNEQIRDAHAQDERDYVRRKAREYGWTIVEKTGEESNEGEQDVDPNA
jgi:hypothetical protein